ncbi:cystathionine beta-lyase [Acidiphilium sp. AL]|uniref:Cystathionine beta-lyase n=1 Tax=Acidiphilium iwatense TaxID=768198 RepID=A0ABS9DVI4_9PROT|nr:MULTISPECIES: cystathionine beta-lyase [Acidiphilium]MCF3946748.1 cystathionine beta-lyase [Acidiphilium iwatense]MCU4158718.1 cystathionine beta-lyase [Acidiphilium sp. AL]
MKTDRFETKLALAARRPVKSHGFVNPKLVRGSTVLYSDCAERRAIGKRRLEQEEIYGLYGTETHFALQSMVAEIEGGTHCQIVSSGLAAVTVPLLAYLKAGDHVLMPDSVYGPTRQFCNGTLKRYGIETQYYDPLIEEAALRALMRPETRVLFAESPGSHTFEVQDVPMLARVARAHGAKLFMDNTWGIRTFQPFRHGVDVSIQALTKYVGGHSDIVLGAVTVATDADWEWLRNGALDLGQYASPDDCWLALRGARTLGVRLDQQAANALAIAQWLAGRPEVRRVLHPALPSCPGHEFWKRDFTGACGLFGIVFQSEYDYEAVTAMVDSLRLFGIGASWGGYESLALPTSFTITRSEGTGTFGGEMLRLQIGLEHLDDLIADIDAGLAVLRGQKRIVCASSPCLADEIQDLYREEQAR